MRVEEDEDDCFEREIEGHLLESLDINNEELRKNSFSRNIGEEKKISETKINLTQQRNQSQFIQNRSFDCSINKKSFQQSKPKENNNVYENLVLLDKNAMSSRYI